MFDEPMVCKELVELVTDYIENELSENDRSRFEEHTAYCRGCQNYMDEYRKTIQVISELADDALSGEARAELMMAFGKWREGESG